MAQIDLHIDAVDGQDLKGCLNWSGLDLPRQTLISDDVYRLCQPRLG